MYVHIKLQSRASIFLVYLCFYLHVKLLVCTVKRDHIIIEVLLKRTQIARHVHNTEEKAT